MRIALICPQLPPRYNGCGDATDKLAREFQARGDVPLVLTDEMEGLDVPYAAAPVGAWNLDSVRRTRAQLDAFRPDVILMQYTPFLYHPRSFYPYLVLRAASKVRTILYAHESFYAAQSAAVRSRLKGAYLALRDRATIGAAHEVYVASPERAGILSDRIPGIGTRVRVVPFGANIEPVNPVLPRRKPQAPFRLMAFGIVMPRRRIELLVRTLGALSQRGIDADLDVVGRIQEPDYAERCKDLARELGIGKRLRFTGPLPPDALRSAFAQTDLLLHGAEEGAIASAGSLLAALAHGVPVLCARTPHDDARFTQAALFADAKPSGLAVQAEAILLGDRTNQLAEASRALYAREFGWKRMADHIAAVA